MNENYNAKKEMAEARLKELLTIKDTNSTLCSAMNYSVMAGGKRLRPVLNLMANSLLDGDNKESLDIACAMEMIHTYSLIHDDLPAMDNDELRRGKPTNHVMFGEAFAILAGDALLNYAFEVMLANAEKYPSNTLNHIKAMQVVAKGSGVYGMVNGQCCDIENEGQILTEKELVYTHEHKTSALINAALLSGLLLCGPTNEQIKAVKTFGTNIGLSFQITDDILDITGDEKLLGKSIGKDKNAKKFTFPTLYGIEKCKKIAEEKTDEAIECLQIFGDKSKDLCEIARKILTRNH